MQTQNHEQLEEKIKSFKLIRCHKASDIVWSNKSAAQRRSKATLFVETKNECVRENLESGEFTNFRHIPWQPQNRTSQYPSARCDSAR